MTIRDEIEEQFRQVAAEHNVQLAPLTDDLELLASGLDSLGFAVVVVRLESALGFDPFSASDDSVSAVTFGEFVKLYENVAQ
ncbi:MAG TPA: phosphopantetheine-binding protein [Acidobacteriaceae bacterium]